MRHCNKAIGCYDRSVIRVYTLVLYLFLPLALLRLWWRGRRQPGYRRGWRERLGRVAETDGATSVTWVHAVSVGEVRAAAPLVRALLQRYPDATLLLTTTTPTGRETAAQLFGDRVRCHYLPWDLPFAVRRFLSAVRPDRVIVLETELWPTLFHALKRNGVPLYLVNARLSDRSLRGYRRVAPLARQTLACLAGIAAQGEEDARRFIALGAPADRVVAAGNLKYDIDTPPAANARASALARAFGGRAGMWVAGSTHAGEERAVLGAHRALLTQRPGGLLWLAPRHPERAPELLRLCRRDGLSAALYSDVLRDPPASVARAVQVVVVDTLGELLSLYALSPVAFIGGSLLDAGGGHNPLEAIQAGCAVVSGARVGNFAAMYRQLDAAGALVLVRDEVSLAKAVGALLDDAALRQRRLAAGEQVLAGNRGALARVLRMLDETVPGA